MKLGERDSSVGMSSFSDAGDPGSNLVIGLIQVTPLIEKETINCKSYIAPVSFSDWRIMIKKDKICLVID